MLLIQISVIIFSVVEDTLHSSIFGERKKLCVSSNDHWFGVCFHVVMCSVFLCCWWDNTVSFHRIATTRSNGTVFQSVFLFCNCTVMFCNIIVPCWFCGLLSRDDRVQTMLLNKTKKKSQILRRSWIFPFDFKVQNSHDLHQNTMIETRHKHSAVVFEEDVVADRNSAAPVEFEGLTW